MTIGIFLAQLLLAAVAGICFLLVMLFGILMAALAIGGAASVPDATNDKPRVDFVLPDEDRSDWNTITNPTVEATPEPEPTPEPAPKLPGVGFDRDAHKKAAGGGR